MLHHHHPHNQTHTHTDRHYSFSFLPPLSSHHPISNPNPSRLLLRSSSSSYYPRSSQAEREKRMESSAAAAELSFCFGSKGSQSEGQAGAGGFHGVGAYDDMGWVVEKGNVLGLGDDFVVDDLLDFGELEESETETATVDDHRHHHHHHHHKKEEEEEEEEEEDQNRNRKHQQMQPGGEEDHNSGVSFEALPPPVSELILPAQDAAELEWVSRIVDDSLSEFPTYSAPKLNKPLPPPQPTMLPVVMVPVKAKRSKRARTLSWSPSCSSSSSWGSGAPLLFIDSSPAPSSTTTSSKAPLLFIDSSPAPSSTTTSSTTSSSSFSCSSSTSSSSSKRQQQQQFVFGHQLLDEIPESVFPQYPLPPPPPPPSSSKSKSLFLPRQKPTPKPKKRGRKPKSVLLLLRDGNRMSGGSGGRGERQCSHCGVNKTPQWRTGPEGAKTLCNACGVRYKSGRLLPEYRPACSPTFMSHVHSNSHRKVMEMRRKKEEEETKENKQHLLLSCPASSVPVASF